MVIEIAGVRVGMEPRYEYTRLLCRDYLVSGADRDVFVEVTEDEIRAVQNPEGTLSEAVCESLALQEKVTMALLDYDVYFLHAAVIAVDGWAYGFTARSGTGKTTHLIQWKKVFGERAFVVNGDRPYLARREGRLYACGSPWCGKEGWQTNTAVPLRGLCFLERGTKNRIRRAKESEVIDRIFRQMRLPDSPKKMSRLLELLDWTVKRVPFYMLECDISEEAARTAYEGMQATGSAGRNVTMQGEEGEEFT